MKDTREQVEKLALTIGLPIPKAEKVEQVKGAPPRVEKNKAAEQYRHPDNESLVWVKGSGRKPKWLNDLLKKEGWDLEDLRVTEEKPLEKEPQAGRI
jgi:DNA-binding protein H-NS